MAQMVGPQRHAVVGNSNTLGSYLVSSSPFKEYPLLNVDNSIDLGYHLHRKKLGEGGFGKVRLATHLKTGHKVAIKMMDKKKLGVTLICDQTLIKHFVYLKSDLSRVRVEINSLKVLRHENIAKLLQVIETQTEIYLILEYCSGGELFDYLVSKNRLPESEAKTIIKDLANALAFIHQNGFAHRDLKPENILFNEKHRIKLIDFGLAAHSRDNNNSLNHLKTCCGSPAYAAPELLQGPNYSGPAVDVWSAGVLLYALLVGRLPFDDESIPALYKKIQSGFYRMPDFLSTDAKDLIKSMLKTNPTERITIDRILLHPWLRDLSDITKPSVQIMRSNFDENVFFQCCRLFPEVPFKQLRENIVHGVGYQTATYWLLKMNPTVIPSPEISALKSSLNRIQRRRSKSLSENNENEVRPALKHKLNEYESIESPKTVAATRLLWSERKAKNSPSKIPLPVVSPKVRVEGHKLKEIKSPNNSPLVPHKKARMFDGITDSFSVKSPFIHQKTPKNLPKIQTNGKVECTPKKSLLKRFLETATPAKSQTPRTINTSMATKNITLTKFNEPQKCIDKLIQTLTAKGINCKQKDFSLRCVLSTNNVIVLSFNLEICKFDNRCVIQRKRLKGDAWNYKKVCEEILRISNE